MSIGGEQVKTNLLKEAFYKKAPSGGFLRTEGSRGLAKWGTAGIKGIPARAARVASGAYETREEWVRFTHFLSATDEEIRPLLSRGMNYDRAFDIATENAAKRVSKWNIDYSALTPFERAIRKRYIPFYTFIRKATPLMLEAMITRPGKINHYHMLQRSIEQLLGVPKPEDDGTVWPEWAKEQGLTRLTGGDEPFYLRDPSPLNVINRFTGGTTQRAPITNVVNMAAPPIKFVQELAQGKTLFNDRPIDNWSQWLLNQVPPLSMGARALGHPFSPQNPSGSTPNTAGSSVAERLSVLGIPIGKMSEARQQAEIHNQINPDSGFYTRVNKALEPTGWQIKKQTTKKNGTYWIVKKPDGTTLKRYRDFNQALKVVQDSLPAGG
jgi:hypothetical protein